ncbi:uncharacterized protein OCT59_029765 [Rhizophagus irregularis]|uniref:Uncharacterized protein n=1 Tax=Rhizophagus irregularis TaxID=588596 RepID=A0A916DWP5_9GLOM|nr:hypothetical protein OCT59_029765 [Rhizophagus irregularis]GET66846.1 hypothetical protein RIR_jg25141.t1 [Rhizophagus irregularis DAOM 181602=DAOM 197198]CAB4496125.1 unnamed protein product [Rhizophagus irregularis]CAB5298256.1 unnamed protein product [Rhizophagus irregularis]
MVLPVVLAVGGISALGVFSLVGIGSLILGTSIVGAAIVGVITLVITGVIILGTSIVGTISSIFFARWLFEKFIEQIYIKKLGMHLQMY